MFKNVQSIHVIIEEKFFNYENYEGTLKIELVFENVKTGQDDVISSPNFYSCYILSWFTKRTIIVGTWHSSWFRNWHPTFRFQLSKKHQVTRRSDRHDPSTRSFQLRRGKFWMVSRNAIEIGIRWLTLSFYEPSKFYLV